MQAGKYFSVPKGQKRLETLPTDSPFPLQLLPYATLITLKPTGDLALHYII